MSRFLIVGLPRSKTAWMSVVASTVPGALCFHEPVTRFENWECCFDIWENTARSHVGIADSGLGFHLERILAEAAPWVLIIRRDIDEVKASLKRLHPIELNYCELLAEKLDEFASCPGVMSVRFEDLANSETVAECLRHLIPGCSPDEERIRELIRLNVQVDMNHVWQFAARARPEAIVGREVLAKLRLYQ